MFGILIEGLILIAIITVLTGRDFVGNDFWVYIRVGLLALVTSVLGFVLVTGLAMLLPSMVAIIVGLILAGVGLGFAISYFYDIELKPAMIGAASYAALSVVLRVVL